MWGTGIVGGRSPDHGKAANRILTAVEPCLALGRGKAKFGTESRRRKVIVEGVVLSVRNNDERVDAVTRVRKAK